MFNIWKNIEQYMKVLDAVISVVSWSEYIIRLSLLDCNDQKWETNSIVVLPFTSMSVFQTELFSVVKSRVCTHVPLGNQHACHDTLHKCTSTWNKWSSCKDIEKGYRTYMDENAFKILVICFNNSILSAIYIIQLIFVTAFICSTVEK